MCIKTIQEVTIKPRKLVATVFLFLFLINKWIFFSEIKSNKKTVKNVAKIHNALVLNCNTVILLLLLIKFPNEFKI